MLKLLLTFSLILMGCIVSTPTMSQSFTSIKSPLLCEQELNGQLEKWMEEAAKKYDINPNFLKAVAHIETRKGRQKYRIGWIGKRTKRYPGTYCGPMAIHYYKMDQGVNIEDPRVNIFVGARALGGVGSDQAAQRKRLTKYNASFDSRYWRAIKQAERKFASGEL
jgi:hypothetical protein